MNKKAFIITYYIALFFCEVKADNPWDPRKYMGMPKNNYVKMGLSHHFTINKKFGDVRHSNNSTFNMTEFALGQERLLQNSFKETPLRHEISLYVASHGMMLNQTRTAVTEHSKNSFHASKDFLHKNDNRTQVDQRSNTTKSKVNTHQHQSAIGELVRGKVPHVKSNQSARASHQANFDQRSTHVQAKKSDHQTIQGKESTDYVIERDKIGTSDIKKTLNVKTTAVLIKTYLDFEKINQITPFIGGGFGIANHEMSNNIDQSIKALHFAWMLEGGLSISVTPKAKLDLSYGYIDMGKVKMADDRLPMTSHQAKIGLRYTF